MLKTQQQHLYEAAYQGEYDCGIPDKKIALNGKLSGKRILVLGCGAGYDVWYLTEENEVVGLDYAHSGLAVAERHGVTALAGDLNSNPILPFDDLYFDVVVCKDVLEHLLDPLTVLKEVRRVLRPTGYAVFSVPNSFYFPGRIRILLGQGIVYRSFLEDHSREYAEWNYMHIRFFTYKGFRRFLAAGGFQPLRWFWDFGNLAHYHQPEMWFAPQLWKLRHNMPLSVRGKIGIYLLRPLWYLFNIVFPRPLRRFLVSLSPGLLCGGFYVHCVKGKESKVQIAPTRKDFEDEETVFHRGTG